MKSKQVIIIICVLAAVAAAGVLFFVFRGSGSRSAEQSSSAQSTAAQGGSVKIACVGDSITSGYALENSKEQAYPAQLEQLLGSGYEVVNYGIAGRTVSLAGDQPFALEDAFAQSKSFKPDIVLLMLGTNDTKKENWNKEKFESDYSFLVESYRGMPNRPQVYVMTPPPLYLEQGAQQTPDSEVLEKEVVPFIREFAKKESIPLIDVFAAFEGKPALLSDGCHPNAQGAEEIAKLVYAQLTQQKRSSQ